MASLLAFIPTNAFGNNEDISDTNVTDLSVSVDSVNNWGRSKVTMRFAEDPQPPRANIEAGDTISVTWPTQANHSGNVYLVGDYQSHQAVTIEGTDTVIGYADITGTGATVTFTSDVENYQHVEGYLSFWVTAVADSNMEEGTSEDVIINSGDYEAGITIHKPNTGTGPVGFSSKSGVFGTNDDGTPNYSSGQWYLLANRNRVTNLNGSVTIVDTLPEGVTFTSFQYVFFQAADESSREGAWSDADSRAFISSHGGSVNYDESSRTLTITLPASAFTRQTSGGETEGLVWAFLINTQIDETYIRDHASPDATEFPIRNNMTSTYTVRNEDGTTTTTREPHSSTLRLPNSESGATGVPQGIIRVSKTVDGTTVPIEGVTFRIYKVHQNAAGEYERETNWYRNSDGSYSSYVDMETVANGVATSPSLDDGTYELAEVNGPDWVVTTTQEIYVTISGTEGVSKPVTNRVVPIDITVTKKWVTDSGATDNTEHPTIYMDLYRQIENGSPELVEGSRQMLANGTSTVVWSNMPRYDAHGNAYTYSVKEVDADGNVVDPSGYTSSISGTTVTNRRNDNYIESYSELEVSKVDEDGNLLDGATFTLYADEACTQEIAQYEGGRATIRMNDDAIRPYIPTTSGTRTIYLKETKAPDGYAIDSTVYPIDLTTAMDEGSWNSDHTLYTVNVTHTITSDGSAALSITNEKAPGTPGTSDETNGLPVTGDSALVLAVIGVLVFAGLVAGAVGLRMRRKPEGKTEE
ncbi:MAG: SpaA isopeptide-forming pilin-related protein [Eggerthellaceae bacterium]